MKDYSPEQFNLAGYKISTTDRDKQSAKDIMEAWKKFRTENLPDLVEGKLNPTLYAVYFNYKNLDNLEEKFYDILLGFEVSDSSLKVVI